MFDHSPIVQGSLQQSHLWDHLAIEAVKCLFPERFDRASGAFDLRVPLEVNLSYGASWAAAKS